MWKVKDFGIGSRKSSEKSIHFLDNYSNLLIVETQAIAALQEMRISASMLNLMRKLFIEAWFQIIDNK